ncbi:MAG: S-layer homology domain-containing protein [Bacillota bacterium]
MRKKSVKKGLSLMLTIILLMSMFPGKMMAEEKEFFTDVASKYQEQIEQLVELGVIKGYKDNTFRPENTITRLQGVTMIVREMKLDTTNRPNPHFKDIKTDHSGYDIIAAAADEGIISGKKDGNFDPNGKLTREQMAKILVEAYDLELIDSESKNFKDVPSTHWSYNYINILASNGITTGYDDGSFKPAKDLTRLNFSLFLSRYINEVKGEEPSSEDLEDLKEKFSLKADKDVIDYNQSITLTLEVSGDEELDYIPKWKATGGHLQVAGNKQTAIWTTEENVTKDYTVTVSIEHTLDSGESITFDKSIKVSTFYFVEVDTTPTPVDDDNDGLTNEEEAKLGTDPSKADTDGDGLKDGEEVNKYKTNPLKEDTDEDGLNDFIEVSAKDMKKLNPLKPDTDSNDINDSEEDFDGDSVVNIVEVEYGTDMFKGDTDGDGLPDDFELSYLELLEVDPLVKDSDNDGTLDGEEDADEDGLTNKAELSLGTDPANPDTDSDTLSDGEEVNTYHTDPLKKDTDDDFLEDDSELKFKTDPLNPDTNGNDILDGNEKRNQEVQAQNYNLSLTFDATGDADKTTVFHKDSKALNLLGSDGMVGEPIDIKTSSDFDQATISFSYDPSNLVNIEEDNLRVFYFNQDTWQLELVDDQSINKENHTVSATLPHFSTYVLADFTRWESTFIEDPESIPTKCKRDDEESTNKPLDLVFVIDSSGSMLDNDPENLRLKAAKDVIDSLADGDQVGIVGDQGAVVDFDSYASLLQGLTDDKELLKDAVDKIDSNGGTNIGSGVSKALTELDKSGRNDAIQAILLLTDGVGYYSDSYTIKAKNAGVKIFTVGLGENIDASLLKDIADETGGDFYQTLEAEELSTIFTKAKDVAQELDTDGDCIADWVEKLSANSRGYVIEGTLGNTEKTGYSSDYLIAHSDDDGLTDLEEMAPRDNPDSFEAALGNFMVNTSKTKVTLKKWPRSNPMVSDTDKDSYNDKEDLEPHEYYLTPVILIHGRVDNSEKVFGVETAIGPAENDFQNSHFIMNNVNSYGDINREKTKSLNNIKYYSAAAHEIPETGFVPNSGGNKTPENLGNRLKDVGYKENKNLFVVNYPNVDFNWKNADILKWFIEENLKSKKEVYPTVIDYGMANLKVDLVGHSNGGLVSRYYIENLGGSKYVNSLITLNTPHWGSGLASASTSTPVSSDPMDVDLEPNGLQYGGKQKKMIYINREKQAYINSYQTEILNSNIKSNSHGSVKYHFIAAYDDLGPDALPAGLRDRTLMFDVKPSSKSFEDFRDSIAEGFFKQYPSYKSSIKFVFTEGGGDNIVNNQSQLGITYKDFKEGKEISAASYTMVIDTIPWHHPKNHLHGEVPHRKEAISRVISYLMTGS